MIDKYIAELLKTNSRVIVPDFGAFMVKTTAGSTEKQISFNDFLKYNDGLLVNHIAKADSISKDEALKKVKAFVEEIQKELKANKPFKVESLGYLFKDPRGSVKFKSGEEKPAEEKAPEVKPTASKEAPNAKAEVKLDEKAPKVPEKETKAEPKKEPAKEAPAAAKKEPEKKPEVAKTAKGDAKTLNEKLSDAKKVEDKPTEKDAKTQVKSGVPDAKKTTTPPGGPAKKTVQSQSPKKKSNATGIIVIAAIVVVIGAGAFLAYLNWDTVKTWLPESLFGKDEPKEVVVDKEALKKEQARKDSLRKVQMVNDSIAKAKQDSIKKAEELKMKNQKKYYLVAGSFKTRKYAERFVTKLNSEGYNAEIFMERHGFFRVSYNSYVDRQQAFNEYRRMKNQNIQVWVLRH
jgi:nucleoid DNA-binding protein